MDKIIAWFSRHLSDPQVVGLTVLLAVGFASVYFGGYTLAPVFASVIVAYLLDGIVLTLVRNAAPRMVAVAIVFSCFMAVLLFVAFAVLPLLSQQATQLFQQLPLMIGRGQSALLNLLEGYPELFSEEQIREIMMTLRVEAMQVGPRALSISIASLTSVITLLVYLILLPLLVFFFLKDKYAILDWLKAFLPDEKRLVKKVWREVDGQLGNYVRGKCFEIIVVGLASYVTFVLMDLQFALLLAVLVGLSVIIPYVGAVAVTFPVAMVAYFQWGMSSELFYLLTAYFLIQALDGNVLVPLLFSEVVNLHPVAIIVAILFFGGIWGFWGVFFAIPLATLVNAVMNAWPKVPTID